MYVIVILDMLFKLKEYSRSETGSADSHAERPPPQNILKVM
jgi:hypothetical protein